MIDKFEGQYAFLSNFYESPIEVWISPDTRLIAPTAEHVFQYLKTPSEEEGIEILMAETPGQAKRLGRKCHLRKDWEEVKDHAMVSVLRAKFRDPELKAKLLATDNEILVEGNTWHDNYWGMCSCAECNENGKNRLGMLLMQVREELRNDA